MPKFRSKVRTFFLRTLYYQKVFPSSVSLGKQNLRHNNHFRAQLFPILIYSILNKKRFSFRNKNVYKRIQNTRKLTLFFLFICFLFILRLLRLFYYVCLVLLFHFILFYIIFCGIYFGSNFTSNIYIHTCVAKQYLIVIKHHPYLIYDKRSITECYSKSIDSFQNRFLLDITTYLLSFFLLSKNF